MKLIDYLRETVLNREHLNTQEDEFIFLWALYLEDSKKNYATFFSEEEKPFLKQEVLSLLELEQPFDQKLELIYELIADSNLRRDADKANMLAPFMAFHYLNPTVVKNDKARRIMKTNYLSSDCIKLAQANLRVLGLLGPAAFDGRENAEVIDAICMHLKDPGWERQVRAIDILKELTFDFLRFDRLGEEITSDIMAGLMAVYAHESKRCVCSAIIAVGHLGAVLPNNEMADEIFNTLYERRYDEESDIKDAAITALIQLFPVLSKTKQIAFLNELRITLEDDSFDVQGPSVTLLIQLFSFISQAEQARVIKTLFALLNSDDQLIRAAVVPELGKLGVLIPRGEKRAEVIYELCRHLSDPSEDVQTGVLIELEKLSYVLWATPEVIAALIKDVAACPYGDKLAAVVKALAELSVVCSEEKLAKVTEKLSSYFNHASFGVEKAAITALGKLKLPDGKTLLQLVNQLVDRVAEGDRQSLALEALKTLATRSNFINTYLLFSTHETLPKDINESVLNPLRSGCN